jgi:predicted aspartyl protease
MRIAIRLGALLAASTALAGPAVIPLEMSAGRPSIDLKLDGKGPYRLLFDTGSGAELILDQGLADELALRSTGTRRIGDPNAPEAIEAKVVAVASVEAAGVSFGKIMAISWKRPGMGIADSPRGVVGLGLFGDKVLTLDYPGKKLIVEDGALPEPDGKTVLRATFEDGIPSLPIDVAGTPFRAHLDSGSTGFLGLPLDAAKTLPLEAPPVQIGRARTASGDYAVFEARLTGAVRIGSLGMDGPKLRFVDLPSANLGSDLLRTLVVSVDKKHGRVRLVSSGRPLEPTDRPRFGVITRGPKDGRLPVEGVAPGSPAETAGLRAGDEIVSLNGHDVQGMSAAQIGEAFLSRPLSIALDRAGETIRLEIEAKSGR